jgi:uncharacterized protein (TIGR02001 family)
VRKQLISLALLALMPLAAQAQEEDDAGFNWNAAATSEYMFRGISQTDDHPAIQAGAGYSWSNGLYVGSSAGTAIWARPISTSNWSVITMSASPMASITPITK